jgi:hypothetical protein
MPSNTKSIWRKNGSRIRPLMVPKSFGILSQVLRKFLEL